MSFWKGHAYIFVHYDFSRYIVLPLLKQASLGIFDPETKYGIYKVLLTMDLNLPLKHFQNLLQKSCSEYNVHYEYNNENGCGDQDNNVDFRKTSARF